MSSNPWEQIPKKKIYPLGEIQRILHESTGYEKYCNAANEKEKITSDDNEYWDSDLKYTSIIQEGLKLVEANKNLSELSHEFESLSMFSRYNTLLSENSIIGKINMIEYLDALLNKLSKLTFSDPKQIDSKYSANNLITIDYNKRKALIKLLKEIKKSENELKGKEVKIVRDRTNLIEKLMYFDTQKEKIENLKEIIEDKSNYLNSITKYINDMLTAVEKTE